MGEADNDTNTLKNNALTTPGNSLHSLIAIDSGGKLKFENFTPTSVLFASHGFERAN
jgi:hypothetical protein